MGNKILIADDDSRINELLQEIFMTEGYEVIAAYDGEEAIRCLVEDADIALLVLDVMMPKLDGWDVFYKTDKSRKRNNGYGIGLSIVRQAAKLHGGGVDVSCENGKTAFLFWIPMDR